MTVQGSKRSERRPNREEEQAWMRAAVSMDAVEGADRKSATVTASPAPAITDHSEMSGFLFLTGIYIFDSAGLEAERTPTE